MVILLKKEIATKLRVCPRTIDNWVKEGKFPAPFFVGKLAVWSEPHVHDWLASRASPSGSTR